MKYKGTMKQISLLTRISMMISRVHRLINIHTRPVISVYKRVIGRTQFFHRRLIIARQRRVIVGRFTEQHVHPRCTRQKIGHAFGDPSHEGLKKTKTNEKIIKKTRVGKSSNGHVDARHINRRSHRDHVIARCVNGREKA